MKKNYRIVSHKPPSCPFCKGKIVTIIYRSVSPETVQEAIDGKLILGGRFVSPDEDPKWVCISCGKRFLEDYVQSLKTTTTYLIRLYRLIIQIIGVSVIVHIISLIVRDL